MFIFIMEGGEVYQGREVQEEDKMSADAGVLDIIDCEEGKQYYEGEWHELEIWGA